MDIIHNEQDRTIVGCREELWLTMVQVLGNGHTDKFLIPQRLTRVLANWLTEQANAIDEESPKE